MYQSYMDRLSAAVKENKKMNKEPVANTEQYVKNESIGSASDALYSALQKLNSQKSNERTSKDRYIAIAITDLEKLIAFVAMHC